MDLLEIGLGHVKNVRLKGPAINSGGLSRFLGLMPVICYFIMAGRSRRRGG